MQILVTGGAGFIGSALIRYLIQSTQHCVVNLDKLTYAGNDLNLVSVADSNRYAFEQADVCDRRAVKAIFNHYQPDMVMHLAAESHVDRSIDGPAAFIETNVVGTYTMLDVSREYWQQLSPDRQITFRFHHVSTDEVYGDLPHPDDDPQAREHLFREETAYAPSSPYSASKASSDHLVRAWGRTYGLPVLVSNCSNNYGPCQYPEKLIPLVILNALSGKPIPVYGTGNQIRDWLYVDDHVRALYAVITRGNVGETYNIGGHSEKRNIEVVGVICDILQKLLPPVISATHLHEGAIKYRDLILHVEDRAGHDRRYAIDTGKIQRTLGWVPQETFESGIEKTVRWYLNNLEWCQRVVENNTPA